MPDFKRYIITRDRNLFTFNYEDEENGLWYYSQKTREKKSFEELKNNILLATDDTDMIMQAIANFVDKD